MMGTARKSHTHLQFALVERRLLNLDLFVQQRQLVVTANQLRTQHVTFVDHIVVHLFLLNLRLLGLLQSAAKIFHLSLSTGAEEDGRLI
jgi:hypothetical protein